jgi:hypothetical protein
MMVVLLGEFRLFREENGDELRLFREELFRSESIVDLLATHIIARHSRTKTMDWIDHFLYEGCCVEHCPFWQEINNGTVVIVWFTVPEASR